MDRRTFLASTAALLAAGRLDAQTTPPFRVISDKLLAPESPKPQPDGSVLVVEMARGTLSRVMPNGEIRVVADLGGSPNGFAMAPDGSLILANNGGLSFKKDGDMLVIGNPGDPAFTPKPVKPAVHRIDPKSGAHTVLYESAGADMFGGCNDVCFDGNGGFYLTDPRAAAVFYCKIDGSSARKLASVPGANGLALSPDHKTFYVTSRNNVLAFNVTGPGEFEKGADGMPTSRVFGGVTTGSFDSMMAEGDGGLAVATLQIGAMTSFGPDGKMRAQYPFPPERNCTSIGFGGKDLKTAYITLTFTGRLIAMDWPRAGLRLVGQTV